MIYIIDTLMPQIGDSWNSKRQECYGHGQEEETTKKDREAMWLSQHIRLSNACELSAVMIVGLAHVKANE